jgi:hypothetical protein
MLGLVAKCLDPAVSQTYGRATIKNQGTLCHFSTSAAPPSPALPVLALRESLRLPRPENRFFKKGAG